MILKIKRFLITLLNLLTGFLSIFLTYSFLSFIFLFFNLIDLVNLPYVVLIFLSPPKTIIELIFIIIVTIILMTVIQLISFLLIDDSYEQIGGTIIIGKENKICSNCGIILEDTITLGVFCSRCNVEFNEEKVI